jgi:putative membrane protein
MTMKLMHLGASALALAFLAGGAWAQTANQPGHVSPAPGTKSDTASAVKDTAGAMVGKVSAKMTTSTEGFVTAAAISDMYEVEAGKLAAQRSSNSAVKDFANHMVQAHTETTDKLKAILASNNIKVQPPAHLDDRRQSMLDNLRGAKAADFDNRYLSQQEAAHEEAQILMRSYATDGDNKAVKQFAAETVKPVSEHLAMVKKIEGQMKTASK